MIKEYEFNNHEEWLAIRHQFIGGSDAGSIIGTNPYKSAYSLWAEKTDKVAPFEGNITTKVGSYLEELVAQMFEDETGKKVRRKNRTMVNDLYPFACANIDRAVVGEKALLEIKTTNSLPLMKQLRNSDEFPEAYYCQVMHYLAVTELEKAYLAVLINCREFKIYELNRDEDEIKALMEAEERFWQCVKTNTPPPIDGAESTSSTILELYPNGSDSELDLFCVEVELDQYMKLTQEIKALTVLKDEMANKIKALMGSASKGSTGNYKVTWGNQSRSTFDTKKFMADHKTIPMDEYFKTSNTRVFKVTQK